MKKETSDKRITASISGSCISLVMLREPAQS